MSDRIAVLLIEARRILRISQGDLGVLLGSSRRSGQRWEGGGAEPSAPQLHDLARRIHPSGPDLASAIAAEGGATLESLGLVRVEPPRALPPPPDPSPSPPARPTPPEDIVDAIVCAAADAIDVTPRTIRPALVAAFTRARRIGLSVDEVERALRPADRKDKRRP